MNDAEEHLHRGLAPDEWPIEDIGERARLAAFYICIRGGLLHQLEMEQEAGVEEKWRGQSGILVPYHDWYIHASSVDIAIGYMGIFNVAK